MKFYLQADQEDTRAVFLTGNFNKWDPHDKNYQLQKNGKKYKITIPDEDLPEIIEYKYTRGGWAHVELDRYGNITVNRRVEKSQKSVSDVVERWRIDWGPFKQKFFPKVEVVSEQFYIPQLDRYRKIWILLPYNYYKTKNTYPVLYLQDAQNLFNEGSEFGNWEIDKKLSILAEYGRGDVVIVAIEHGDSSRAAEYVVDNAKGEITKERERKEAEEISRNSEGKRYIRFITDTLKPYIDAHYRTKKERNWTGIGGSSLGGLISIYAGFLYPEVYSKLLIFSPSLWVEPNNQFPIINFRKNYKTKVYLYGGEKEGSKMVERIFEFEKSLKAWEDQKILDFEIKTSINPEGKHQEFYWSQEFPRAMEWLYYDNIDNPIEVAPRLEEQEINTSNTNT